MAFTGGAYSWLFQSTDLNPVSVLLILESESLYLLTWCSAKYCIHLNRARQLSNRTCNNTTAENELLILG